MSYMDLLVVFLFLWIFATKRKPPIGFDKGSTGTIRGIAMLLIILHHIHLRIDDGSLILGSAGYMATGFFFFVSGYGNHLSIKKRDVTYRWLVDKFVKIYSTFFAGFIINWIILKAFYKNSALSIMETIRHLLIISLPNQVSWFPKMILLSFIIHWTLSKYLQKYTSYFFWIIDLIILGLMVCTRIKTFWWFSFLCYPLGITFAENKEKCIERPAHKFFFCGIICMITALAGIFFDPPRVIASMALSMCCFYLTGIYHFDSKILSYVGNNSFEFYVFHIVCWQAFAILIDVNVLLYGGSVLIGSFVLVHLYLKMKLVANR